MNPETAPVEEMLVDMLKTFSHPVHREKIISQIISYLIITKNDLIQALKYVPMLLSITNLTCIYSLQVNLFIDLIRRCETCICCLSIQFFDLL